MNEKRTVTTLYNYRSFTLHLSPLTPPRPSTPPGVDRCGGPETRDLFLSTPNPCKTLDHTAVTTFSEGLREEGALLPVQRAT